MSSVTFNDRSTNSSIFRTPHSIRAALPQLYNQDPVPRTRLYSEDSVSSLATSENIPVTDLDKLT